MVSQKFVDEFFPGCDFLVSVSPRLFVVEQMRIVGRTQDSTCALCGLEKERFVEKCSGTPFRRNPCTDVVRERLVAEVCVSKSGRILPFTWQKEIDLDF